MTPMSGSAPVSTTYGPEVIGPPPRPDDQQLWDPLHQAMDPEERREIQDERVRDLIRKVLEVPVPLFRRKLEQAGITDPRDVKSVDDLSRIPVTVKQDLRDSEAEVPPWGEYRFLDPRRGIRLGTSTGTTGTPTITIWTRKDLWVEYESGARNWWRAGYRPGEIITHAHPSYLYGGGPMLQGTYEYLGLLTVWVPPPDTDELAEQALRFWTRVTPDHPFMGFTTGRFLEVAAKVGIDLEEAGLTGLKAPRGFGMGRGGMPLLTAGAECYSYLGGPCGELPGAHIHEDWAVVQAVDPETGQEVSDGEWGNLVVTTLDRDNGLLRYDLEEACALLREPCTCGETSIRGLWGGRAKDLLSCQGTRFQLNEVEGALREIEEVSEPSLEYQVVRPDGSDRPLEIRVEAASDDPGVRERARERAATVLKERLGVRAEINVLRRDTLPRSGYKAVRVVDPD